MLASIHDDDAPLNAWLDRGSLIAAPVLVCLVIFFQWFTGDLSGRTLDKPLDNQVASESIVDPTLADLTIGSKIAVRFNHYQSEHADVEFESSAGEIFAETEEVAISRTDRFRAAIVSAEIFGPRDAVERLTKLKAEVEPDGALAREIGWVLPRYQAALDRKPLPDLPAEVVEAMRGRHGWFASLANAFGRDDAHPDRWYTVAGAENFMAFADFAELFMGARLIIGIIVAIVVIIVISQNGVENADDPHVPTTVYLQAFCVFALIFSTYLMAHVFLLGVGGAISLVVSEAITWSCALAAAYPLLRGVGFRELAHDLGFIAPRGVTRELLVGVVGYMAGVPITLAFDWLGSLIDAVVGMGEETSGGIPLYEAPMAGSWVLIILGTLSSCLWAPVVEETMFRGCLYRWCRVRLTWIPTTLLTATIFGAIHPYSIGGMISVFAGGLVYGLLREWRQSLYAPIVAHALHNGTIQFFEIGYLVALN